MAKSPTESKAVWNLVRTLVPPDAIRLFRIRAVWPRVAGDNLCAHTWPAAVARDELTVHVHDHQWLHELTYMRQELLSRLQTLCPEAELGRLRLRLGPIPPLDERGAPPEPELPPAERRPPLAEIPDDATVAALHEVEDIELRHAIASARLMLGRRPGR